MGLTPGECTPFSQFLNSCEMCIKNLKLNVYVAFHMWEECNTLFSPYIYEMAIVNTESMEPIIC